MLHNSYWALSTLSAIGRTTPDANKAVLPRLLDELGKEKENNVSKVSDGLRITMDMISDLGSEGEEFIPKIMPLLNIYDFNERTKIFRALAKIGTAAIPALVECVHKNKIEKTFWHNYGGLYNAFDALQEIGKPAIPALKSFTGFFSGDLGKAANLRIKWIQYGKPESNYDY